MKFRRRDVGFTGLDTTPMIILVFQLLMFFMIVINLENTSADERVKLPKDSLAKPPTVKPEHELVLEFGYRQDSTGAGLSPFPEVFCNEQFVDVRQIRPALDMERRVLERVHGVGVIKDVTVLIRADSDVPNGMVQELIKKCQEAGFSKFSLKTSFSARDGE